MGVSSLHGKRFQEAPTEQEIVGREKSPEEKGEVVSEQVLLWTMKFNLTGDLWETEKNSPDCTI